MAGKKEKLGENFGKNAEGSNAEATSAVPPVRETEQHTLCFTCNGVDPRNLNSDDMIEHLHRGTVLANAKGLEPNTGGHGSGAILSEDGYIVTNHHVIAGARENGLSITLYSSELDATNNLGAEYAVYLVGTDPESDVAVIKISKMDEVDEPLTCVKFGNSEALRSGHTVIAIGNPYNMSNSLSKGVVSNPTRTLNSSIVPFIQSDLVINPGNSGGPLFNKFGELVGINSQIITNTGSFIGLSLSLDGNTALQIINDLICKGRVTRGWLGADVENVPHAMAKSMGHEKGTPKGVLITNVEKGGPAGFAGLREGDVVKSIDGQPMYKMNDFVRQVMDLTPYQESSFVVWNADEGEKTISVIPEDRDETFAYKKAARIAEIEKQRARLKENGTPYNIVDMGNNKFSLFVKHATKITFPILIRMDEVGNLVLQNTEEEHSPKQKIAPGPNQTFVLTPPFPGYPNIEIQPCANGALQFNVVTHSGQRYPLPIEPLMPDALTPKFANMVHISKGTHYAVGLKFDKESNEKYFVVTPVFMPNLSPIAIRFDSDGDAWVSEVRSPDAAPYKIVPDEDGRYELYDPFGAMLPPLFISVNDEGAHAFETKPIFEDEIVKLAIIRSAEELAKKQARDANDPEMGDDKNVTNDVNARDNFHLPFIAIGTHQIKPEDLTI